MLWALPVWDYQETFGTPPKPFDTAASHVLRVRGSVFPDRDNRGRRYGLWGCSLAFSELLQL
ncbi:hypothetical protein [Leeuwenhoekiella blandensis]|uniref:hypothetical protein n=1 Tax=Leeuwenhoekiella blandensis TaxID=360293 RepID=UPI001E55671E|nr:hypothetical protein [Leeuwenhoekiella blandensis]